MSWALLFRAREYLKGSLWFYPLTGAILGVLLALLTLQADASATVPKAWQYAPSTASTVLTTIVGATVGLAGFVVTMTVLAIQMATGTFSARYMRIWYRDPMLKAVLTVLAGTLTFSFSLLRQVSATRAPNIGVSVAGFLLVLSLVLFLLFFDRFIHRLRPVEVAALAMQAAVGDFVATGQHLVAVFGDGNVPAKASRQLQRMAALGVERTVEQDPAFAIRIMADIAVKALSAAINDPPPPFRRSITLRTYSDSSAPRRSTGR